MGDKTLHGKGLMTTMKEGNVVLISVSISGVTKDEDKVVTIHILVRGGRMGRKGASDGLKTV